VPTVAIKFDGCTIAVMTTNDPIAIDVIRKSLERSGYLMKSRIVSALDACGFFVEPNVSHKGTEGQQRAIDITTEARSRVHRPGICVKTTFVIQAVNNAYPIVLLTERPSTPNADFESYVKFGISPDPCPFHEKFHPYEERAADWHNLFSELCMLAKEQEQEELVAGPPLEVLSSVLRACEYTEQEVDSFNDWTSEEVGKYWRVFFWHPLLVVSGQLLTAKVGADGAVQLQEVPLARLEVNWHDGDERRTTVVEVIREDFLLERLEVLRTQDDAIEERIHAFRLSVESGLGAGEP